MSKEHLTTEQLAEAEKLFQLYTPRAARVAHLRHILSLTEHSPLTEESALAWAEDVKSVLGDFCTLTEKTAILLRSALPARS